MKKLYQERTYRNLISPEGLERFEVKIKESDLLIFAEKRLEAQAYQALAEARREIERYIERDGEFARTLSAHAVSKSAPEIVREMAQAASDWGVGPLASVAGAIAERVGRALLDKSRCVIVENGGDIFLSMPRKATLRLYAGEDSPFTGCVLFTVPESGSGLAVCTSSARVGHSLSFGSADAVVAMADNAAYADAAATAIANRVQCPDDVARIVEEESKTSKLRGLIVAAGECIGFLGDIEIVKQEV
jgi:ApbE superfamily uncharacterized protein (UPF0280 family)